MDGGRLAHKAVKCRRCLMLPPCLALCWWSWKQRKPVQPRRESRDWQCSAGWSVEWSSWWVVTEHPGYGSWIIFWRREKEGKLTEEECCHSKVTVVTKRSNAKLLHRQSAEYSITEVGCQSSEPGNYREVQMYNVSTHYTLLTICLSP